MQLVQIFSLYSWATTMYIQYPVFTRKITIMYFLQKLASMYFNYTRLLYSKVVIQVMLNAGVRMTSQMWVYPKKLDTLKLNILSNCFVISVFKTRLFICRVSLPWVEFPAMLLHRVYFSIYKEKPQLFFHL